ncbi:uncharacterized protein LOC132263101 [Phlebotomus argentipes]|uniref:uncharacterized protein LOC132263101 n=1 Tax=Phlebotomus argentipes TaxID=94469 RepID=UPI0028930710|nr:uncharacterized protein LOC132263101 [Phlebotomus argentipes]
MDSAYTSIFKIDGEPILPPLMTEAVRLEMRQYREQALKLEERLKHMKELSKMNSSALDSTQDNLEDPAQGYVTCKSFDSTSDLLTEVEIIVNDGRESPLFVPSKEDRNANKESDDLTDLTIEELASNLSISERSIPPIDDDKSALSVPVSPTDKEKDEGEEVPFPRLVRSNSYTLDAPSPHLADFLKKPSGKQSPIPMIPARNTLDLRKVKSKVDSRLVHSKTKKVPSKAGLKRVLGSPSSSQIYKCPKSSVLGKLKTLQVSKETKTATVKAPETREPPTDDRKEAKIPDVSIPQNQSDISEFLLKIEAEHKVRMQELLDIQREEQRRFRETFNEQQKLLLDSLKKTFPEISLPEDSNGNEALMPSDQEESEDSMQVQSFSSPQTRQDSLDRVTQVFLKQHLTQVRLESDTLSPRSQKAASVINAHVRGYLVRRLLRTEPVQQIIQTFHDTCVFLSQLHRDSQNKNSNPTDIELKRRLLQQLRSSLGSLHGVFFQMPVKERMDIIAKDRESIRQRLQRATQRRSQSADSRKSHQQLNKMKIVAL